MKVPIDDYACLDLDAPTLAAYETVIDGATYWVVWCKHCRTWHRHGPAEGHREAHCPTPESPYFKTGYNTSVSVSSFLAPISIMAANFNYTQSLTVSVAK